MSCLRMHGINKLTESNKITIERRVPGHSEIESNEKKMNS